MAGGGSQRRGRGHTRGEEYIAEGRTAAGTRADFLEGLIK